jgi:hypothetical protein
MKRRRIRRGPTLGGVNPSWRWEVAAPLALIGVVVAGVGARTGGDFLFWLGVALIALAAVAFSAGG